MKKQELNIRIFPILEKEFQTKPVQGYKFEYKGFTFILTGNGPYYREWAASDFETGFSVDLHGRTRKELINKIKGNIESGVFTTDSDYRIPMDQYNQYVTNALNQFGPINTLDA